MGRKIKKRKSGIRRFVTFLLLVVIASLVYCALVDQNLFERENVNKNPVKHLIQENTDSADKRTTPVPPSIEPTHAISMSPDKLNSSNAILIRIRDHAVLMQKKSEERIYPASLTKMMTAIVAIENLPDLKKKIELTDSMFEGLHEADASLAGFEPGEKVQAIDLLYGVLLPSGAECCVALADQIAGSEHKFVKMMNQKAAKLGMNKTHFENSIGLHNENHYTTVKDLAHLLRYALQNDTFRKIFTSSRHSTPPTNKHTDGITYYNTMFKELNDQNITNGKILGGKTGYTEEAGLCLASLAKVGKQEYILITAGAKGDHQSEQHNITDALTVYSSMGK